MTRSGSPHDPAVPPQRAEIGEAGIRAIGVEGDRNQGPYMQIEICIESGRITDAAFETYDCPAAVSCGAGVTRLVKGETIDRAREMTMEEVIEAAGDLPLGKLNCADLAIAALCKALSAALGNLGNLVDNLGTPYAIG